MARARIIYNPTAGRHNFRARFETVARFWQQHGWAMALTPTHYPGHATVLAQEAAAAGEQLVVAAGGDGTLSEVATGLAYSNTIMAPLPVGTANSFARELGLPKPRRGNLADLMHISAALLDGTVQSVDLGCRDTGRYFLLWSGAGIDSFLVKQVEPRPRWSKRLGPAGFILQSLRHLPQVSGYHLTVTVDNTVLEDKFLIASFSNCRLYAGEFMLSPEAVMDDGLMEVWLFRGTALTTAFRQLAKLAMAQHLDDPDILHFKARSLRVTAAIDVPVHADGDVQMGTPFYCEVKPGALKILAPRSAPAGLFSQLGPPIRTLTDLTKQP